jgi:hypothetical protein
MAVAVVAGCPCRCHCSHRRACCHCACRCCSCCCHCCHCHRGVVPVPPPLPMATAARTAPRCNRCRCCCCHQRGGRERAHRGLPLLPPSTHCRRIPEEDWEHLNVGGGCSLPPHPHLPLPPTTMGSVVIDVYWHDQLNRTHGRADGVLAPMFPLGMGRAGGGGEQQQQRGSGGEEEGSCHQMLPPSTSTSTSTSSATRARATVAFVVIIVIVVTMGIATASAAAAASECGAVLAVLDAWLQPGVEAQPAVEVDAAGHNQLVHHCLKADGAWELPVVASQESLLVIAVGVVIVISSRSKLSLESLLSWRPMQIPPPECGGAAGLQSLLLSSASLSRLSY